MKVLAKVSWDVTENGNVDVDPEIFYAMVSAMFHAGSSICKKLVKDRCMRLIMECKDKRLAIEKKDEEYLIYEIPN